MSDPTRSRINAAFEDELTALPVPPGLRALSVRAAVAAPRAQSRQPQLFALVAAVLAVAVVVTLVIGSHAMRSTPVPVKPTGSLNPPSARSGADLVYDGAHQELVLFGGSTIENKVVNETWTWDGKYWTLQHPKSAPVARHDSVMAYDAAHHDVLLYGGIAAAPSSAKGGQSAVTDTWTWDGTSWKEQHPMHQPIFSFDWAATMEFDPVSRTVLLYGFAKTTSENLSNMQSQTWSWNGSDWTQLSPSQAPTMTGYLVAGGTHIYLLAGSAGRVGGRYVTQMWQWDGSTWTLLGPNNNHLLPLSFATYDPEHGRMVALNGDTWTWDGSSWTRQHVQDQPPAVGYMAYFAPMHQVISFGSRFGNTNNDLWAWTGTYWKRLEAGMVVPFPSPSGQLGPTTPAAAETFIRQTVKAPSPVLLPRSLPPGLEARAVVTADGFNIEYVSDQRDKRISLGIVVANPPPGDQSSNDTNVQFGSRSAEYFVYDAGAPQSDRWLMWSEGGSPKTGGTPYFLFASGLTNAEFWQVANSLG
jgi:hypothetical protein